MRFLVFCFMFCFMPIFVLASWTEIAYDKKYDELEGEAFFLALQSDKKAQAIQSLLPRLGKDLSKEAQEYFTLWSAFELKSAKLPSIVEELRSGSPRIRLLKISYYLQRNQLEKAYDEAAQVDEENLNVEVLDLYLKLGLLQKAGPLFLSLIAKNQEPTYNFLAALSTLQKLDGQRYKEWLYALKVLRPLDDLSLQLWIEISPQFGIFSSAEALRTYCRYNVLYCFHAAEFLRQNKSPTEAWLWASHITNPRDHLKFKLHSFIDSKSYLSISHLKDHLKKEELLQEDRYAYAMYYSLAIQKKCAEASAIGERLLRNPSYSDKIKKLSGLCLKTSMVSPPRGQEADFGVILKIISKFELSLC